MKVQKNIYTHLVYLIAHQYKSKNDNEVLVNAEEMRHIHYCSYIVYIKANKADIKE